MKATLSFLTLLLASQFSCSNTCESKNDILITVSSTLNEESGCYLVRSDEYNCHGLQEALELISSTPEVCTLFNVQLEPVEHYITRPVTINSSVHIYGGISGDRVPLVSCTFNADIFLKKNGELHTLYFNQSDSVEFSYIRFEDCPLPIRIDRSNSIVVEQSSFRFFSEAVFDIHNTIQVAVHNCSFIDNYGTGIIVQPYRGNTGGLSISYSNLGVSASNPIVTVSMSNFVNNSALPSNNTLNTNQAFRSGVLTGRGGGLGLFVKEDEFNVTANILGCHFSKNVVRSFGGGMYILFNGGGSHAAFIEDSVYENNTAMIGGAGMILVGIRGANISPHSYYVKGCKFIGNFATIGAGIYYFIILGGGRSNGINIENSSFIGNCLAGGSESFGAALATDIEEDFDERESLITNNIKECLFSDNVGENSIVSIGLKPFVLSGTNRFINNNGSVLRIVGSATTLSDTVEFINNTAVEGAAVLLLSLSQLILADHLQLLFDGNTGRFGASIVVSDIPSLVPFERLLRNPLCFFILRSDPLLPPSEWQNFGINITFTRNSAWFGSAIYASSITSCSWVSVSIRQSFDVSYFPKWPILNIRDDNFNGALSDAYNQIHSIVTDPVGLEIFNTDVLRGWPGETLTISMEAKDELGNPTGSLARLSFLSQNQIDEYEEVELDPNTLLVSRESFITNITFAIGKGTDNNIGGEIVFDNFGVSLLSRQSEPESISFIGTNCIGGYTLSAVGGSIDKDTCQCDRADENVLLCEEDQDSIIIKNGHWVTTGSRGSLFSHVCPFGYCRCFLNTSFGATSCFNVFTNSDPDRQCVCGRKGTLCGECAQGTGVSVLLNVCSSCKTGYISLIPILIFVIIVIMMLIVIVDKPLPQWSYPILFYLHTVPLVTLHFPLSFISIGKYLIYLGSALSFYFPFDFCIHSGMTSLDSYGLKFIPAIAALVTIPAAVLIRYFLSKITPWFSIQSFNGYGIWSITLLVYTFTLYNSTTIINCPMIPDINGAFSPKWYIDGSMECFKGGHIPLALFAIFWIILLVLLVPITILLTYKAPKKYIIFKQLGESLKEPFMNPFGFWCGVELFRRLFVAILVTAFPDNSVSNKFSSGSVLVFWSFFVQTFILLFIMVLLFLYGYWRPYKDKVTNILEICLLILFSALVMLRANYFLQDTLEIALDSSQTSIPSCDGGGTIVTSFSSVLAAVYYCPVLIGFGCLFIWMATCLRQLWLDHNTSKSTKPKDLEVAEIRNHSIKETRFVQSTEICL